MSVMVSHKSKQFSPPIHKSGCLASHAIYELLHGWTNCSHKSKLSHRMKLRPEMKNDTIALKSNLPLQEKINSNKLDMQHEICIKGV